MHAVHLTRSSGTFDSSAMLNAVNICDDLRTCLPFTGAALHNVARTLNASGWAACGNT